MHEVTKGPLVATHVCKWFEHMKTTACIIAEVDEGNGNGIPRTLTHDASGDEVPETTLSGGN